MNPITLLIVVALTSFNLILAFRSFKNKKDNENWEDKYWSDKYWSLRKQWLDVLLEKARLQGALEESDKWYVEASSKLQKAELELRELKFKYESSFTNQRKLFDFLSSRIKAIIQSPNFTGNLLLYQHQKDLCEVLYEIPTSDPYCLAIKQSVNSCFKSYLKSIVNKAVISDQIVISQDGDRITLVSKKDDV